MSRQDRDDAGSARRQAAEAIRRQGEANYELELARQARRRGGIEIDRDLAHVAKAAADAEPQRPRPTPFRGQSADLEPDRDHEDDIGAHLGALRLLLEAMDDNPGDAGI